MQTVFFCDSVIADGYYGIYKPFSFTKECPLFTYVTVFTSEANFLMAVNCLFFALFFGSPMAEFEWRWDRPVVQQDFITANLFSSSSVEVLPLSFHPLGACVNNLSSPLIQRSSFIMAIF